MLGIPTHFVFNETHAWIEVRLPDDGFMRIDLGGAARQLDAHGEDRPVYHPRLPDPLPQPAAYLASYSRLAGPVSGVRDEDTVATQDGPVGPHSGGIAFETATGDPSAQETSEPGSGPSDAAGTAEGTDTEPSNTAGQQASPTGRQAPDPRQPVELRLEHHRFEAFRGRRIELSGQARDSAGRGVAGLRVEVGLRGGGPLRSLGATVTEEGGWFSATLGVPPDLNVGDYVLSVHTPGDAWHLPASAR